MSLVIHMKKLVKNLSKHKKIRFLFSILMILFSSFLQVSVIQVFMNPCNLLTSGFTGVAILINKITELFGISFSTSLGILVLNIPAALLCFKGVSKRFVFLSCLQFTTTSFLLKALHFDPFFDDRMLNVLFGGFLYGMCSVLALKADGSTTPFKRQMSGLIEYADTDNEVTGVINEATIKTVMRYAGPRMLFTNPILVTKHFVEQIKRRREV